MTLINSFFVPLIVTIVIEGMVALVAGYSSKRKQLAILLINLMTNSLLNFIVLFFYFSSVLEELSGWELLGLEGVIVIVEWRLLLYVFRERSRKLFWLSLGMNASSLFVGLFFLGFWY